eukprot:5482284-Amphidinium_carterae.1
MASVHKLGALTVEVSLDLKLLARKLRFFSGAILKSCPWRKQTTGSPTEESTELRTTEQPASTATGAAQVHQRTGNHPCQTGTKQKKMKTFESLKHWSSNTSYLVRGP